MVFSSFAFIIYFLPVFFILYLSVPKQGKNAVIFIFSLIFYYYGVKEHPAYILLILASVIINYAAARFMETCSGAGGRRAWLFAGLIWNFGSLFIFKYMDFAADNINSVLQNLNSGFSISVPDLVLPIGISFYTFQISSYLIDVYRGRIQAEHSLLTLGTYLCMFPQLIAGPIVTYSQVSERLRDRTHSFAKIEDGLREFTIGLSLKVLIANRVGGLWSKICAIGFDSISCPLAWLGIAAFTFQIYFDFYGYSLMAKGLGRIMGFEFPDNFRSPYLSRSMTEFWRRWHITLGSWFREYIYIPLGGNRRHMYLNLFLVWMLTGLWHGASWNFVLWGFFLFVLIALEKCGFKKLLDRYPVIGHIYMLFVIPISWLIFAVTDMQQLCIYFGRLFPFLGQAPQTVFEGDFAKYAGIFWLSLTVAAICCTGIPRKIYNARKYSFPVTLILVILFWCCIYCMYMGLDDPFLYYQF